MRWTTWISSMVGLGALMTFSFATTCRLPDLQHAVNLWMANPVESLWFDSRWTGAEVLAIRDLTGDGLSDLLLSQDDAVYMQPGNGDGTFGWAQGDTPLTERVILDSFVHRGSASFLNALLVDVDQDADLDLILAGTFREAWAEDSADRVCILRQKDDRPGEFAAPASTLVIPDIFRQVAIASSTADRVRFLGTTADLNEDGWSGKLYTFTCSRDFVLDDLELEHEFSGRPFAVADFNGDGRMDVGLILRNGLEVRIAFDGPSGFVEQTAFVVSRGRIRDVVGIDMTDDGALDLLAATSEAILQAVKTAEGYRLSTAIPKGAQGVSLVDLDGDGQDDLLAQTSESCLQVYPGTASGRFLDTSGSAFVFPLSIHQVHLTDWNRDGQCDLLLEGTYDLIPVINSSHGWGVTQIPFEGNQPIGIADIDGNGASDILVNRHFGGLDALFNRGDGQFVRAPWVDEEHLVFLSDAEPIRFEPIALRQADDGGIHLLGQHPRTCVENQVARPCAQGMLFRLSAQGDVVDQWTLDLDPIGVLEIGDLDGDGEDDVIASSTSTLSVLWSGRTLRSYTWDEKGAGVFVSGDFDDDGIDELAVSLTDHETDLTLVDFTPDRKKRLTSSLRLNGIPLALQAGDMDGDGVADPVGVVVRLGGEKEDGESLHIELLGVDVVVAPSSRTQLLPTEIAVFPDQTLPWPLRGLALIDANGDGNLDAMSSGLQGEGIAVLYGDGEGAFAQQELMSETIGPLIRSQLDGEEGHELISATLGLDPALWIQWNGGEP